MSLTHYDIFGDPFGNQLACDFTPTEGETFGTTGLPELVTCPDCILRLESAR